MIPAYTEISWNIPKITPHEIAGPARHDNQTRYDKDLLI
jgi:hypothetical protein